MSISVLDLLLCKQVEGVFFSLARVSSCFQDFNSLHIVYFFLVTFFLISKITHIHVENLQNRKAKRTEIAYK